MQLLLVRHALPLRSEHGEGSDPALSEAGMAQAQRLPDALARYPIARVVSSPQRRAIQTAEPVAKACGLTVDVVEAADAEHTVVSTNGTEHVWDLLPRNQAKHQR